MTTDPVVARGSRISARLRITGWLLLTTLVGLTALVLTVSNTLQASMSRQANTEVAQEIEEFTKFVSEGRDPETAEPFTTAERILEVYLSRQAPSDNELILGRVDGQMLSSPGATVDAAQVTGNAALLQRVMTEDSGVATTATGEEVRWGGQAVSHSEGQVARFAVVVYMEPLNREVSETTKTVSLVSLGVLALTAVMGYVVAGQILRPIREVRVAAANLTEHALTQRIPVTGRDDVAELTVQFNAMLDRLEQAFSTQQRFVDDAAHELRTPITIVRGHLELMGLEGPDQQATVALVMQELDRMSRIVSDLLELAKAERPDFLRLQKDVDVAALTLEIDAKVQGLPERQWLLTHVAEGAATLDPQRVTQAVLQLAKNAVQHTTPGDAIRLASQFGDGPDGPEVMFTVSDTGPGVHPADVERIFERFSRGDETQGDAATEYESGAGLGLSIVRAIANAHGGAAFVESEPGHGSTFGIAIPLHPERDEHHHADELFEGARG